MATTSVEDSLNVFKYIKGGREGAQRRFGELIVNGLRNINGVQAYGLGSRLRSNLLPRIVGGDYSGINLSVIEILADQLGFTFDQGFGEFVDITPEEEDKLLQHAKMDGFASVGGPKLNNSQYTRMYLFSKAVTQF